MIENSIQRHLTIILLLDIRLRLFPGKFEIGKINNESLCRPHGK